jgi:hypothetical protein
MIPRLIHQTWKSSVIEAPFRPEWMQSWRDMNPGWHYRLWTDQDLDAFVRRHHPAFYRDTYCRYDCHIKQVDAWRYLLLKTMGGVYADLDTMCLTPVEEWCRMENLVLGCQFPGDWKSSEQNVCNAVMASALGHPFWDGVEQDLHAARDLKVIPATGPGFLTRRMQAFLQTRAPEESATVVLSPTSFYPFPWDDSQKQAVAGMDRTQLQARFPSSFAVNFWTGSWVAEANAPRLPKILVGVCSCLANVEKRAAVRETWMSLPQPSIDVRFFVGAGTPSLPLENDVIQVPAPDTYDDLPAKVLAFFREALAFSDFDWLFKCDDDTYVALDRLRDLTTGGHELVGNEFLAQRGSPSGGAGYLLSRRIVQALVEDTSISGTGAEDILIGEAAIRHGALHLATDHLCMDTSRFPAADNLVITSHWCNPARLREIHNLRFPIPDKVAAPRRRVA